MAMKLMVRILAAGLVAVTSIQAQPAPSVLFIGNSFTFADGAPVRFYRADTARASSDGGAGLGLAIARWIVDLHGGEIHPEPRVPHGCRMVVTLPGAPPLARPIQEVSR